MIEQTSTNNKRQRAGHFEIVMKCYNLSRKNENKRIEIICFHRKSLYILWTYE